MACRLAHSFKISRLLAGVALVLMAPLPALAQAPAPIPAATAPLGDYAVGGVAVTKTGDNVAQLREQALTEGQGVALRQLLQRLLPSDVDPARVMPRAADIAGLVEGYDIEQENTTANRYTATVTYRFRPTAIRGLVQSAMQDSGAPLPGQSDRIRARIALNGVEEWIEIRKRLAAIPVIRSTGTIGLNRTEAVVELTLAASIEQVTAALARRDMVLEAIEGGYVLRALGLPVVARPPVAPAPPAAAASAASAAPPAAPPAPAAEMPTPPAPAAPALPAAEAPTPVQPSPMVEAPAPTAPAPDAAAPPPPAEPAPQGESVPPRLFPERPASPLNQPRL